jgi:hypothetical protein
MVQPPPTMPHPIKQHTQNQQYNQSVFQSVPSRMNDNNQQPLMNSNKMSHHPQDTHGFYNQQTNYGGHQFHNNGAGSSSSNSNNFYQPFNNNNNMGHYSVRIKLSSIVNKMEVCRY